MFKFIKLCKFEMFFKRFVAKSIANWMIMPIFQGIFVVSWPSGLGVGFKVSALRVRTLNNVFFDQDF